MMPISQILNDNVRLLKTKAARPAIYGVSIAVIAIMVATLLVSHITYGAGSLEGIVAAQRINIALWARELMPFGFAFWGQYVSSLIAYEAGAMVIDQTQDLRTKTTALEYQAMHDATHDALTDLPSRLKHVVREADTLARLGGDEFAVILNPLCTLEDVHTVVGKVQRALAPPYALDGLTLDVQASVGGALYPEHGSDADTLLQRADIAMYAAKQDQKSFVLYSDKLDQQSPRRLTLMSELRDAIKNDELTLRFRPIVNNHTQSVSEAEVLVSCEHKIHGTMVPDEFIPLAERTGLIYPLTQWVMRIALRQQAAWRKLGLDIGMAVNVSAQTLLDPEFIDQVTGLLAAHDVPPQRLVLEITESSIMFVQELALHILSRFADMGVRIAIDDFGTGYSSLSYLRKLPVSQLKIDKSFVLDMLDNENDAVSVNATFDLGHNLGL